MQAVDINFYTAQDVSETRDIEQGKPVAVMVLVNIYLATTACLAIAIFQGKYRSSR